MRPNASRLLSKVLASRTKGELARDVSVTYSRAGRFASVTETVSQHHTEQALTPSTDLATQHREVAESHGLPHTTPPFAGNSLTETYVSSTLNCALLPKPFAARATTTRGRAKYTLPNNPPPFRHLPPFEYQRNTRLAWHSPQNANSVP